MRRFAFILLLCASPVAAAPPSLDADANSPIVWRVVVQAPQHPLLPPTFREQFCKDVRMALQTGLAPELCRVEVIDLASVKPDQWEPLWTDFHKNGWPALDTARILDGKKTHFLKIDIKEPNTFRLEAKQHDGFAGLSSPSLRSKELTDTAMLGRWAGLLLSQDFGPTGTVVPIADSKTQVRIRLRGGKIPGLDKQIQANDVFAFSVITQETKAGEIPKKTGPGAKVAEPTVERKSLPQPYTYLRAVGPVVDGEVRCEILSKFVRPLLEGASVVGYRCRKIPTLTAPVRLQIRGTDGQPAPANTPFEIWGSESGFTATAAARDRFELRDGVYTSLRPMQRLACVVVKLGTGKEHTYVVRAPEPGDGPLVLTIPVSAAEIAKAEYEQTCEKLRGKLAEATAAQAALFEALTKQINAGKNDEALKQADTGMRTAEALDKSLRAELDDLRKQPGATDEAPARLLNVCENQLKALAERRTELAKGIEDLRQAVAKANDPVKIANEFRANELVRTIQLHVGRGEVPKALELYDELIELTKQPDLPAKKEKLAEEWKPKNEEHTAARTFLLETWRKAATLEQFKEAIPKLKGTLENFDKNGDKLGLRNFLSSVPTAVARLGELLGMLDGSLDADRAAINELKGFLDSIRDLDKSATAMLKK